jgi:hypothetical protein
MGLDSLGQVHSSCTAPSHSDEPDGKGSPLDLRAAAAPAPVRRPLSTGAEFPRSTSAALTSTNPDFPYFSCCPPLLPFFPCTPSHTHLVLSLSVRARHFLWFDSLSSRCDANSDCLPHGLVVKVSDRLATFHASAQAKTRRSIHPDWCDFANSRSHELVPKFPTLLHNIHSLSLGQGFPDSIGAWP